MSSSSFSIRGRLTLLTAAENSIDFYLGRAQLQEQSNIRHHLRVTDSSFCVVEEHQQRKKNSISEFPDEKAQNVYRTCLVKVSRSYLPGESFKQKYTHLMRRGLFWCVHIIVDAIPWLSFQCSHAFHEEIEENPPKA